MEIGTNIRKCRRERDMTQEQLAECLSISVSAVSQWESSKTMPDLSMIPSICHLFRISADELLGINQIEKERKIKIVREQAKEYTERGLKEKAVEILETGLREFPNNFDLMLDLMYAYKYDRKHLDDIIRLGNTILDKCTNDDLRCSSKLVLCYAYLDKGESEKALEIARTFSPLCQNKDAVLSQLLKGIEGYRQRQNYLDAIIFELDNCLQHMNYQLDDGSWAYTDEEMIAICDKHIALYATLFEDGNYGYYHSRISVIHQHQAKYYAKKFDMNHTLHHLNEATDHAIMSCQSERISMHTALLFRGTVGRNFSTSIMYSEAKKVLEFLNSPDCDFLRYTPEFTAIQAKLEGVEMD